CCHPRIQELPFILPPQKREDEIRGGCGSNLLEWRTDVHRDANHASAETSVSPGVQDVVAAPEPSPALCVAASHHRGKVPNSTRRMAVAVMLVWKVSPNCYSSRMMLTTGRISFRVAICGQKCAKAPGLHCSGRFKKLRISSRCSATTFCAA